MRGNRAGTIPKSDSKLKSDWFVYIHHGAFLKHGDCCIEKKLLILH